MRQRKVSPLYRGPIHPHLKCAVHVWSFQSRVNDTEINNGGKLTFPGLTISETLTIYLWKKYVRWFFLWGIQQLFSLENKYKGNRDCTITMYFSRENKVSRTRKRITNQYPVIKSQYLEVGKIT